MKLIFSIILFAFYANYAFSARILGVFMTPSYSHQIVYQPIWKELSLRGHQVTVITPNPLHDANLINLTEIDVSSSYKIFRDENEKELLGPKSLFGEVKRFSRIFQLVTEHQLSNPKVQKLIKDRNQKFDLVLVEYLYPAMYVFKDVFNCPMIGITSLGLTPYGNELIGNPKNPALEPDIALPFSVSESFTDRVYSTLIDLFGRALPRYLLLSKLDQMLTNYIDVEVRPLSEICQDFSLVILNSNLAIRNPRPIVPNLIEIAGIHIKKPNPLQKELKAFLDKSVNGVVYFSLGSNMKSALIPQQTLDIMMEVFTELPYNVLWKFEKDLPKTPKNVYMQKWLPQQDVLAHPNIKVFISQAGIQSIDEAVFRKVPLLLVPVFGDQEFNAHHMVRKGAALSLSFHNITKENLKNSILELMQNPKYQNNMNKLSKIASDQITPPLDKAIWWIEYVLRHDGAKHLRYTGRDAPFYQFYMLDILAVILAVVAVSFYLTVFFMRMTFRLFTRSSNLMNSNMKQKTH